MSHNVRRVMEGYGDEEASMHPTSRRHDANATPTTWRGVCEGVCPDPFGSEIRFGGQGRRHPRLASASCCNLKHRGLTRNKA